MRITAHLSAMVAALAFTFGCSQGAEVVSLVDASVAPDYTKLPQGGDAKSLVNNLIGRWYPEAEIKRLDDDTMVPEEWCKRPPTVLQIWSDEVKVQCDGGDPISAPIARVQQSKAGGIDLVLRAKEDAAMRVVHFVEVKGPKSVIEGTPCFKTATKYARFPKFETLQRSILAGKRCSQVILEKKMMQMQ